MNKSTSLLRRFGQRLISSACALLTVSVLAALAAPTSSNAQSNLLTAGDFEGISSLTAYSPSTTGVWGAESSALSGAGNGITPFGSQMLQLNHASGGSAAQTNQIIAGPFVAGSVVTFTAKFNTWVAPSAQTPQTVAVIIQTNTGIPLSGTRYTSPTVALDSDLSTWQTATVTTTLTSDTNYLSAELVLWMYNGALPYGTPLAYVDGAVVTVVPPVYGSGLSSVTAWDPIFLNDPVVPDSLESKPVPTVGYNDPRWTNAHAAFVFPLGSHPWEGIVPYNFSANWINAWAGGGQLNQNPGLHSHRHGKTSSSPGWAGYPTYGVPYQSFTKYSTTVSGQGEFVLQFLADNASWIYVDGALVGYQDYSWGSNGTGRYLITLATAGTHDLGFVIWDGGGLAGGKFRLETRASFEANNPGVPLPPRAATVSLSNLSHTYDGTPKAAGVTTAPGGLNYSVTYDGSTTAPTNVGSYAVVATVTSAGYAGSATGTLTISKATATITLANLTHTYDGTVKSATATTTPANLSVAFTYNGTPVNAGTYGVLAIVNNSNYTATASGNLVISKANATVLVNGYTGVYDAAAHGASGTATGVGGVNLSAWLNLGASFTDVPGGTATWTFAGGNNYNDASGVVAIVITKANATVVVNGYTGVYDGIARGATGSAAGVGGANLSAGLSLGATFTNVPGGTANWAFAGGINYNDANGSAAVVISKANATVVVNGYTGVYDGIARGATGSATGVGGVDLSAGLNLGTTFTDVPGGTATWTFAGGTNYNDASGTAAVVIAKANATVLVNGYTGIYDGAAHGATGSATGVGGVNLSAGLNLGAAFTDVPGGTATWTFVGGTNYNDASGTAAVVIAKANATVPVNGYTGTYDGVAHGAAGSATGVGGVNLSAGLNLGASFTDVPGGTATWTFAGGTNYNDASGTAAVVITKANATVPVNGYTGTYDGVAHGATGLATGVGGVDLSAGLNLGATFTDVPGGTANWSFTGGTNYNDASASAAITITKATATVVVAPYNATYDGNAKSSTVTSITGANGETGGTVGAVTLNTTNTNAGTYAGTWSFIGAANYNDIAATAITNTIAKATAAVVVTPYSVTYNGAPQSSTVASITGVSGETGGTVGAVTLNTTNTNAGTYAGTWSLAGAANYNNITATPVTNTIAKATATVVVAPYSVTYDGNAQSSTVTSITGVNNETGATVGTVTLTTTHTNAGTYGDSWSLAGAANYNNIAATPITNAIAKANPVVAVTGYSLTYDGLPHTATGSAIGVKGEVLSGLNLSATTRTNTGTTTDAWTFTDTTGNYNNAGGSVMNVITKAATKTALGAVPSVQAVGQPITLTATVTSLTPVVGSPDGTVTFNLGATVLGTALVNGSGVAVLTTTAIPLGPQSITSTYSGSSNFIGSASSAVSVLVFGYPTGGGTFVIGDGKATVGAAVNFWGSQWEKNNALSGGASNASFKGFAVGPTPPVAGGTFTAAPGNSAPSPASVPAYLGVIVTSKVVKSGSNITGTIVRLVVVKTNPGYAGNPGSAGTGTVVAVIP